MTPLHAPSWGLRHAAMRAVQINMAFSFALYAICTNFAERKLHSGN